jgi:alpha-methylacyl-CoA racemase
MMPLENIKILDLSHLAPGMYCTMILSDLGAEVLRVEQPPKVAIPSQKSDAGSMSYERLMVAHRAVNRNKRSITLNLKTEEARQVIYTLVGKTDIVIEEFRPGTVERLGVDYQTLSRINPRIIYCSMSGYGQDGPYRDIPGHDVNYIAMAGVLDMIGGETEGLPVIPPNLIADYAGAGLHAVIGILTALLARGRTGRGQYVDISFLDGVISMLTRYAYEYFANGVIIKRGEGRLDPSYNVYQTKEGRYISIGSIEPWFWENLCRALGREDLIPYQHAAEKQKEIHSYFSKIFLTKTREGGFGQLKLSVPVGKVYSIDEVFTDPQVLHRQMVVEVENPQGEKEKQVGLPIKLSDTPARIRTTAPVPGQHTEEVLLELGYSQESIAQLQKSGAISLP